MLAHKATHEAKVAAEVGAGHKRQFDATRRFPPSPTPIRRSPGPGLTETEAKAKGIAYEKAVFPWAASGRSLAIGRDEGFTKLIFDPETHRVIGGGIVGTNAGDLISEVMLAIEMGADAADIGMTIHPHPTLSETVAMAAEAFDGSLTDLYIPKQRTTRAPAKSVVDRGDPDDRSRHRAMHPALTRSLRWVGLLETGRRVGASRAHAPVTRAARCPDHRRP